MWQAVTTAVSAAIDHRRAEARRAGRYLSSCSIAIAPSAALNNDTNGRNLNGLLNLLNAGQVDMAGQAQDTSPSASSSDTSKPTDSNAATASSLVSRLRPRVASKSPRKVRPNL